VTVETPQQQLQTNSDLLNAINTLNANFDNLPYILRDVIQAG